jgi:hypothetical protein
VQKPCELILNSISRADEGIRTPDPRFTNVAQGSCRVSCRPILNLRVWLFSRPEQSFSAGIVPRIVPRQEAGIAEDPLNRGSPRVAMTYRLSTCLPGKCDRFFASLSTQLCDGEVSVLCHRDAACVGVIECLLSARPGTDTFVRPHAPIRPA